MRADMGMNEIKASDVERFTRDLISLSSVYNVSEDGYVILKGNVDYNDDDRFVTHAVGTQLKRLMVLKEIIKDNDALVINPLNENIAESPDSKWLYVSLSVGLARRIIEIAKFLTMIVESEKDTSVETLHLSPDTLAFAARHKEFDSKVFDQFKLITNKSLNFVNVWYNRKLKESYFRCSLYNPDTIIEFPQVTKKAWKIITAFMSDLLGVSTDPEKAVEQINQKFTSDSDLITVPKLESMLKVYGKIYHRLNRYIDMCEFEDEDFVVDLTSLDQHIANISEYYQKAKWFIGTSSVLDTATIRQVQQPSQISISNIPTNPSIVNHPTIGYVEPASNIPSNPNVRPSQDYYGGTNFNQQSFQQPFRSQPTSIPIGNQQQFGGYGGGIPIRRY